MKNEINLLPQKKRRSTKDSRQTLILRLVSLGLLLLVATSSAGIFLITALSPLQSLRQEEQEVSQALNNMRTKSIKYVLANTRLTDIGTFLDSRLKYPETLEDMQSLGEEEVSFTGIKLYQKDVTLTVSSNSLKAINEMVNGLKSKSEGERLYSNFSISNLDYQIKNGVYVVGLNVTLR